MAPAPYGAKPLFPPKLSAVKLDVLRIVNMKIAVIDGMMIFHQVTHRLVSRHQPDAEEVQQEEEHHQAEKEQDPVRPFQHGDLVRDRGLPVRTRPPDSSPGEALAMPRAGSTLTETSCYDSFLVPRGVRRGSPH